MEEKIYATKLFKEEPSTVESLWCDPEQMQSLPKSSFPITSLQRIHEATLLLRKICENDRLTSKTPRADGCGRVADSLAPLIYKGSAENEMRAALRSRHETLANISAELDLVKSDLKAIVGKRNTSSEMGSHGVKERLQRECTQMDIETKIRLHELMRLRAR